MGINVKNVTFSYSKDKPLFNNLNLEISDMGKNFMILKSKNVYKFLMKRLISKVTMFLKTQNKITFLLKVEQQAWACMYFVYFKETF